MALKKPSEYFKKDIATLDNSVQDLVKEPELNTFSDAFESFKKNLSKIEILSEFSDTLDNYRINIERVNHLSEKVDDIQTEIQTLLKKEDLDRAMMSQLIVFEESIREVQNKVKGINENKITEIKLDVSGLTKSVNEFLQIEVPKYKKLIVDSEFRTDNRFSQLEDNVNQTLEGIGEFVENRYKELTESIEGINEKSLSVILEDFKLLEKSFKEIKEKEIPKYKGFIVDTERKSESKLNEFDKVFNETVSSLLEKINSIELNESDLISQVSEKIKDVKILKEQVSDQLTENNSYKRELDKKVQDLEINIIRNESHIKTQNESLQQIQDEVKENLSKINIEEIQEQNYTLGKKIKYLEEVFEKFSEKEILTENIIAEPPSTKNTDPLTPLDKNYVTLDQLQQHYRLFINRIQQQLATLGGGGETRFEFLDDIDRDSVKINGNIIQYDSSVGKFIGTSYTAGGGGESSWVVSSSGISTTSSVGIGTTNPIAALEVVGDTYITGIITAVDFNSASDISLKTNIQSISDPLDKVMSINGVQFDWLNNGRSSMGVIAQDIEKIIPELVNGSNIKTVNYNGLVGLLIEVVKNQQQQINDLKEVVDKIINI